jgi:NADH-quinone oxidoreductase subunit C
VDDQPIFARVQQRFAASVEDASVSRGVMVLTIAPEQLIEAVRQLKSEFGFDLLLDVTAVDWQSRTPRFEVVHHFYSTVDRVRVRVKARVPESDPTVDSLVAFYGSAHFMERECHDMYGIAFRGNPDLRPILLYEGFVGHPLRKDYPKEQEQPLVTYRS